MLRFLALALVCAAASGAPQLSVGSSKTPVLNYDDLMSSLNLNDEQKRMVMQAESSSVEHLTYKMQKNPNSELPLCHSLIVDPALIKFTLYGLSSKVVYHGGELRDLRQALDLKLPTQILIHGRLDSEKSFNAENLSLTYAARGKPMNLITLDYSQYSGCQYLVLYNYTIPEVASLLADMIQKTLVEKNQVDPKMIRMTGFGMGAHLAGLAAKKLPQQIQRITGLDPAGFLYNLAAPEKRLNKGDAKLVDIIYTNRLLFGMNQLVGDINFLPSGGRMQKACANYNLGKNGCSHHLAMDYYLESVQRGHRGFIAKPASSYKEFLLKKDLVKHSELMGEDVSGDMRGDYYLEVNDLPPYSKGVDGAYLLEKKNSELGDNEY